MAEIGEARVFPGRLHHAIPAWVRPGASYHVRLRVSANTRPCLTADSVAASLLAAVENYHVRERWFCHLFLLMPDHTHALLSFPRDEWMSRLVGEWKAYAARALGIQWQPNFFDHRIRSRDEFRKAMDYIRRNPVAKGYCQTPEDWPWFWMRK